VYVDGFFSRIDFTKDRPIPGTTVTTVLIPSEADRISPSILNDVNVFLPAGGPAGKRTSREQFKRFIDFSLFITAIMTK